jgi:hypothetical protein
MKKDSTSAYAMQEMALLSYELFHRVWKDTVARLLLDQLNFLEEPPRRVVFYEKNWDKCKRNTASGSNDLENGGRLKGYR